MNKRLDCDTCKHFEPNKEHALCSNCVVDDETGIPTNYNKEEEFLDTPEPSHEEVLEALATLMDVCETYMDMINGCDELCPLRRTDWEQEEGFGVCALETPSTPTEWTIHEPDEGEDYPILLETASFDNEDTECPL